MSSRGGWQIRHSQGLLPGLLEPAEEAKLRARLEAEVSARNLEAEQLLSTTQPLHLDNHLQRGLRKLFRSFGPHGELPAPYRSGSGRVFRIPSALVPLSDDACVVSLPGIPEAWTRPFFEQKGGRRYLRLFFHPADVPAFRDYLAQTEHDPRQWFGSPSSSHRSLFALELGNQEEVPFVLKVSLRATMMGFSRELSHSQVARGVVATAYVREAFEESRGILPDGGRWFYMPECFGVVPPGLKEAGYLVRRYAEGTSPSRDLLLPYYAVLSSRPEGRWFEILHEASGVCDRREFLWTQLMRPLLSLFHLMALDYGLVTELHKQNVGVVVSPETLAIRGIYLRDMDALDIDLPYRRHLRLPDPMVLPEWARALPDVLRADKAQLSQAFNFCYLGAMNFDQLAKGCLPRKEAFGLLRDVNEMHYEELKRRFGVCLESLADLTCFWDEFHQSITSPEDYARVPMRQRKYARWYARLREIEIGWGAPPWRPW